MKNLFSFSESADARFIFDFGEKEPVIEDQEAQPEDKEVEENPEKTLDLETRVDDPGPDKDVEEGLEKAKADYAVDQDPELAGQLENIDAEADQEMPPEEKTEQAQQVEEEAGDFVENLDANSAKQAENPGVTESVEQDKAA